jgi:hypothetical protein
MMFPLDRHHLEQERDAQLVQGGIARQLESIYSARVVAKDVRERLAVTSYALRAAVKYVGAHLDPGATVE